MPPPIPAIVIHALNILIGIFSITILALVARSVILTNSLSVIYPQDVKGTGRGLLFWPGVGGIVDMLLFLFLWVMASSVDGSMRKRKTYWNALHFVACFILGRPLIVLIYIFIEYSQATRNQVTPSTGFITTETWSCAAANEGSIRTAETVCTQLRAARYLLIPEVVLGTIMLSLVIWMRTRSSKEQRPVERADSQDVKV